MTIYAKRKRRARTARLVQPILNGLQLRLELLVLQRKTAVSVLKQCLEILYPLVPRQKLALCDTSLLLERGVLVNQLRKTRSHHRHRTLKHVTHTCFCTNVSCSKLRSKNAIFCC